MTSFILKIIAVISMSFDHIGYLIFGKVSYFNYIGRIAFPIFAFQISEGYTHTSNLKKYILRLSIFALISQIPYYLFFSRYTNSLSLNIFFTLLLGLFAITFYDKSKNKLLGVIGCLIISALAELINVDYGWFGVIIIFCFYIFKEKKFLLNISYILLVIIKYLSLLIKTNFNEIYIQICLFSLLPLFFINSYNKKQGKKIKYFLYIYYPTHLLLLYLAAKYDII